MSKSNLKPYMISEIGLNHNGDIDEGYKLIKASKASNCDAVKFQIRSKSFFLSDIRICWNIGPVCRVVKPQSTALKADHRTPHDPHLL